MIRGEKKLTPAQLTFFLIQTQIGIGILSLPNELAVSVHQDSWISVLIAGFIIQIDIMIIWMLARRFPNMSIYEILPLLLGKPIGKTVHFIYFLYNLSTAVLMTVLFTHVLDIWVFNNTPNYALNLLIILAGLYIAVNSLLVISRFYMFVSFLLIVPLLLSLYVLTDVKWFYILPVGSGAGAGKIMMSSSHAFLAFIGFEVVMVVYPQVAAKTIGKLKSALVANALVTLFYCFLTIICLIYYSPKEIMIVPLPLLFMLKEFAFSLLERTDLLFLTVWVTCIVTSFATYLHLSGTGLSNLARKKSHKPFMPVMAFICLIGASFVEKSEAAIVFYTKYFTYCAYAILFVMPLSLLLISLISRKKENQKA